MLEDGPLSETDQVGEHASGMQFDAAVESARDYRIVIHASMETRRLIPHTGVIRPRKLPRGDRLRLKSLVRLAASSSASREPDESCGHEHAGIIEDEQRCARSSENQLYA